MENSKSSDATSASVVRPQTFKLTFGRHREDRHWRSSEADFDELRGLCAGREFRDDKDGTCVMPGSYVDNDRSKLACTEISVIILDVDGQPLDEIDSALDRWNHAAFLYTTHSHRTTRTAVRVDHFERWAKRAKVSTTPTLKTLLDYLDGKGKGQIRTYDPVFCDTQGYYGQDGPRGRAYFIQHRPVDKVRIVIPLREPIATADLGRSNSASEREFRGIIKGIAAEIGVEHDAACEDLAHLFYLPSSPTIHRDNPEAYTAREYDGPLLDYRDIKRLGADQGARPVTSIGIATGSSDLARWYKKNKKSFNIVALIEEYLADEILEHRPRGGVVISCPFEDEHTQPGGSGTFADNATDEDNPIKIFCSHDHCQGRRTTDFIEKWVRDGKLTLNDLGIEPSKAAQRELAKQNAIATVGVELTDRHKYILGADAYLDVRTGNLNPVEAVHRSVAHLIPDGIGAGAIMLSNPASKFDRLAYRVGEPIVFTDADGLRCYNRYRPGTLTPIDGDASPYVDHVAYLFGDDEKEREHFLDWLAFTVQHPEQKIRHGCLIGGGAGARKGHN